MPNSTPRTHCSAPRRMVGWSAEDAPACSSCIPSTHISHCGRQDHNPSYPAPQLHPLLFCFFPPSSPPSLSLPAVSSLSPCASCLSLCPDLILAQCFSSTLLFPERWHRTEMVRVTHFSPFAWRFSGSQEHGMNYFQAIGSPLSWCGGQEHMNYIQAIGSPLSWHRGQGQLEASRHFPVDLNGFWKQPPPNSLTSSHQPQEGLGALRCLLCSRMVRTPGLGRQRLPRHMWGWRPPLSCLA